MGQYACSRQIPDRDVWVKEAVRQRFVQRSWRRADLFTEGACLMTSVKTMRPPAVPPAGRARSPRFHVIPGGPTSACRSSHVQEGT